MPRPRTSPEEAAESLAVQALTYLGSDIERLTRFLALSGLGPESLRAAAYAPGFFAAVLDHIASNEKLLIAFAAEAGVEPAHVDRARRLLSGGNWERETP